MNNGEDSQDEFGTKFMIKALYDGQKDLHTKIDVLHKFMEDHMAKEEQDLLQTRVHLASLDEKINTQNKNWGLVSTVVTSVLSALGVSFFAGHKG